MFNTYTIAADSGYEFSIKLRIDTNLLTKEIASNINDFWGNSERMLKICHGDLYQAVARRAAFDLFYSLIEGYSSDHALQLLSQQEGWPSENLGIEILSYDILEFDATQFYCIAE